MTETIETKMRLEGLESNESKLRLAEERYRTIIRTALDGFWIVDQTGRFIDVNDAYCSLIGYSREELLKMHVNDIEASETPEETARHIARVMEAGHDRFETRHRCKDRRIIDIEVSANYMVAGGGCFFGFLRDITEIKKSAEKLTTLSFALDQSPSPMLITDTAGTIEYVNRSFTEAMGVSCEEAVGTTPCFLEYGEPTKSYLAPLWDTIRSGRTWRGDVCCTSRDGHTRWDLVTVSPIRDAHGKISHFITVRIDDSERRRAEDALRESEERYRMLHSTAFDGVIIADTEGRITETNPSAEKMFGYGKGELVGRKIVELMPERFRAAHAAGFRRLIETGEGRSQGKVLLFEGLKRDGTTFPIELIIGSFEINGMLCFTGTFRDITERSRLETEVLKTQKLESLGVLAGGIAHNFNNLLTGILGNIFLAKGSAAGGDALKRLEDAERGIGMAKDLTQRLLTFSKGGSPVKQLASVSEIVTGSADFVLSGSTVRPEYSIAEGLWAIEADEGLISQVIQNLVMNAAEAMPDGGVVKVSCENAEVSGGDIPFKDGRYVKITVADSGVGILRENLERIFDPYFTTKEDGTGLGLSASYSIIKNHDGHISVESIPGKGSAFCVYLPASTSRAPEALKAPSTVVCGSGRVLVMDDEEVVRETAGAILDAIGYTAAYAKDGAEAIDAYIEARAKGEPFDAVIMDLTVPGGMGGKEAITLLLQIDPSVKAIVSSGYSNDPVMSEFARSGFKAVIPKPYTVAEFSLTVNRVIRGG